jgi:hypothetical protein
MKRLAALLLVAGAISLSAQTAAPTDPLASVAWMAGGVWRGEVRGPDGSVKHFQVHTHQEGPDDYTWALFSPQKDSWAQLIEIHYHCAQS